MKHNARRRKVHVTELQKDTIRLTFTCSQEDFPVTSKTSLQRELKEMDFKYGQAKRVNVLMDAIAFQAFPAVYFGRLNELWDSKTMCYYIMMEHG
ncbi:unnamed protein product [Didymodactylos carnosus]|uniref:Uncharacterized protein n=1 Tax=Didymodactylos carnosus TaxID=1234261 RepID=A0A814TKV3_9BILA|nr:unnamed protein product [Didymodactylos carnosus]CAF1162800.1 unnamed protein product [Didymodactylos carnosus]CAF3759918.1 unnamed protein product [Didymodactylos carnosus]CAF3926347.1 unnamed protein product [Didymodactylos carnosus]